MMAGVASAQAGTYEGHLKGLPSAGVDFEVGKVNGKRKVTDANYSILPYHCDDPTTGFVSGGFNIKARIRKGAFDLREEFVGRFAGELLGGGKAKGIIKVPVTVSGHSGCTTGKREWVAHKV
jgi:hypothetical protein